MRYCLIPAAAVAPCNSLADTVVVDVGGWWPVSWHMPCMEALRQQRLGLQKSWPLPLSARASEDLLVVGDTMQGLLTTQVTPWRLTCALSACQ
jgi:hypothetical protein